MAYARASTETEDYDRPTEKPTDRLMYHMGLLTSMGFLWPGQLPHDQNDAARWFVTLLEPQSTNEGARRVPVAGQGSGHRWEYPYHTRLQNCLHQFFRADKNLREFVLAAREDNVFWRGEPLWHFSSVYEQTIKYHSMPANEKRAYAMTALREMRNICTGVKVK